MSADSAPLRDLKRIGLQIAIAVEQRERAENIAIITERALFDVMWKQRASKWITSAELMDTVMQRFEELRTQNRAIVGVTTGLIDLDRILGGWHRGDLVIVAARTSLGKSSLMCSAALSAAHAGHHVGIVSLEMSEEQIGNRLLAIEGRIDLRRLTTGQLNVEEFARAIEISDVIRSLRLKSKIQVR